MTDQPKQDAIVSQRDRELLEAITGGNFDFKPKAKRERLQMIATYRAEIEAATIERCAEVAEGDLQLAFDGGDLTGSYYHNHTVRCIATAIRNLKGQTS